MSTDTVRREVVLPATRDEVWEAITLPEALRDWFGAEVDWDVRPGGPGQFREEDGTVRQARVAQVDPGHHLAFTWWPEGREGEASRVDYDLEEVEWGTRLVVTETQARTRPSTPVASTLAPVASTWSMWSTWSVWDGRLLGLSLRAGALVPA